MPVLPAFMLLTPDRRRTLATTLMVATLTTVYMGSGVFTESETSLLLRAAFLGRLWFVQLLVAAMMLTIIARGYARVPTAGPKRMSRLALLVMQAGMAALVVHIAAAALQDPDLWRTLHFSLYAVLWTQSLACLLVLAHAFAQRGQAAAGALHQAELRRLAMSRELDAARLQLLQAQVEPHFLFNALANVRRLLRTEPGNARTLLGDLLRYLQEALPTLRDQDTTLGREAELVRAFLAVHQVRMGHRLQARVEVPAELLHHPVPPMVLLTLVENALKHGLQPLVDGGRVDVTARVVQGRLQLTVADNGRGMGSGSGGGTGLANLRARLRSLHGPAASLALALNEPSGVVATVLLPLVEPAP